MLKRLVRKNDFKKRNDLHVARKIWHAVGVMVIFLLYQYLPDKLALLILGFTWVFALGLDIVRLRNRKVNDIVLAAFHPVMRDSEIHRFAGTTYLLTGALIVLIFFPRPIVNLAFLFLAFADPIASYFGIRFGKDRIFEGKSIQGTLAAVVVCTIISLIYLYSFNILLDRLLLVSLLGGIIGGLAELIQIGKLDDNLTLPVFSATGLTIVFYLFGFSFAAV